MWAASWVRTAGIRDLREKIAAQFNVDLDEIESRHHLVFDSYERGHMGFEDYLRSVFFNVPRPFTRRRTPRVQLQRICRLAGKHRFLEAD